MDKKVINIVQYALVIVMDDEYVDCMNTLSFIDQHISTINSRGIFIKIIGYLPEEVASQEIRNSLFVKGITSIPSLIVDNGNVISGFESIRDTLMKCLEPPKPHKRVRSIRDRMEQMRNDVLYNDPNENEVDEGMATIKQVPSFESLSHRSIDAVKGAMSTVDRSKSVKTKSKRHHQNQSSTVDRSSAIARSMSNAKKPEKHTAPTPSRYDNDESDVERGTATNRDKGKGVDKDLVDNEEEPEILKFNPPKKKTASEIRNKARMSNMGS